MDVFGRIRRYENLHIALWLVKDTCWMLELKMLGTIMIVPTILMALYIVLRTLKSPEILLNLAVLCWILANSFWMISEFFFGDRHRHYSLIPFIAGLLLVLLYYVRWLLRRRSSAAAADHS